MEMSFIELVMIGVVALVVLGPEKLPGAIRTVSLWVGRLRRSFNHIKQDIEREIGADDIRRQLRNEAILDKFKSTKSQVTDTMNMVKKETEAFRKNVELEAQAASFTSTKAGALPATSASSAESAPTTPTPPMEKDVAPIQNDLQFSPEPDNQTAAAIPAPGSTSEK